MPTTFRASGLEAGLPRGRGLLFEKRVYGFERVAFDDKPFLFWSGLTLLTPRFVFLGHTKLVSYSKNLVPEPGIGPGRHEWARDCKSRLSASSSTRGSQAKGPHIAALCHLSKGIFVVGYPSVFVINSPILLFASQLFLGILSEATENFVNRRHWGCQVRKIVAAILKSLLYVLRREPLTVNLNDCAYRISQPQSRDAARRVSYARQRSEVLQNLVEVGNFVSRFAQLCFELSATTAKIGPLTNKLPICLTNIVGIHNGVILPCP